MLLTQYASFHCQIQKITLYGQYSSKSAGFPGRANLCVLVNSLKVVSGSELKHARICLCRSKNAGKKRLTIAEKTSKKSIEVLAKSKRNQASRCSQCRSICQVHCPFTTTSLIGLCLPQKIDFKRHMKFLHRLIHFQNLRSICPPRPAL